MCCSFKPKPSLIVTLVVINIGISLITSAFMFILTYPGDECLLFASVRGHALIYGNPVGCNYISYGHCFLIVFAIFLLVYISYSKKGEESQQRNELYKKFPRISSSFAIGFSLFIFLFALLMSAVSLAGYLTSCNELHYEAKNQLYARLTLGNPYRFLSISCNSLFSEDDFHNRFHHDHYEYSGMFYGQNRGYKHGRVHKLVKDHQHLLPLEIALEGSLAASFFSWFIWLIISILMFLTRSKTPNFDPLQSQIQQNEDITQISEMPHEDIYHQQNQIQVVYQNDPALFFPQIQQGYNQAMPVEWSQQQAPLMNQNTQHLMYPQQMQQMPLMSRSQTPTFTERNQTLTSSSSSTLPQQSELAQSLNLFNYAGIKCSQL